MDRTYNRKLETIVSLQQRVEARRQEVMTKAPLLAEKILEGYSPMYACKKFLLVDWLDFRAYFLEIPEVAHAYDEHKKRNDQRRTKIYR